MSQPRAGLIGMGLLGSAIAERLMHQGWQVQGYDLAAERRAAMKGHGVEIAENVQAIASSCKRVLLSLPTSDVVAAVLDEMAKTLRPGQYVIDTTTGKPAQMAAFGARLAERGVHYLDATVAGSSAQVRARQVTVLVGGEAAAFENCLKVLAPFAARCFHVGGYGSGAKFKLVHNLMLGMHRAVLGEALAFAEAMQLDLDTVLEVLKQTPAYSCVMDTKGRKMVEGDFKPQATLSQHLKDVRLMLEDAGELGLDLPLTKLHETLLAELEAAGEGGQDNSAIINAFRRKKPAG